MPTSIFVDVHTLDDVLYEGSIVLNNGPCVGYLQSSNTIKWLSYSKAIERSLCIGSYLWTTARLTPMQSNVAILSSVLAIDNVERIKSCQNELLRND
ncbi:unnamed protein product [Adineta ricciae]|uniref:Uncharacterized protein n=1 Tax=Adineta ricciae TaxID=249248 RepID=A0A815TXV8_ADIRI|nr:unnamed protein product [Adineta ricciae]CAF1510106.1 unnamed protein product [Adineta ricciae]